MLKRLLIFCTILFLGSPVSALAASLSFSPETLVLKVGERREATITLDPEGKDVIGVDVLIHFDPNAVSIKSINKTDAFENILGTTINNTDGSAKFALTNSYDTYTDKREKIATIELEGKHIVENSALSFNFILGRTRDTNVAVSGGQDALTSVGSLSIKVIGNDNSNSTNNTSNGSSTTQGDSNAGGTTITSSPSPSPLVAGKTTSRRDYVSPLPDEVEESESPVLAALSTVSAPVAQVLGDFQEKARETNSNTTSVVIYAVITILLLFVAFIVIRLLRKHLLSDNDVNYTSG